MSTKMDSHRREKGLNYINDDVVVFTTAFAVCIAEITAGELREYLIKIGFPKSVKLTWTSNYEVSTGNAIIKKIESFIGIGIKIIYTDDSSKSTQALEEHYEICDTEIKLIKRIERAPGRIVTTDFRGKYIKLWIENGPRCNVLVSTRGDVFRGEEIAELLMHHKTPTDLMKIYNAVKLHKATDYSEITVSIKEDSCFIDPLDTIAQIHYLNGELCETSVIFRKGILWVKKDGSWLYSSENLEMSLRFDPRTETLEFSGKGKDDEIVKLLSKRNAIRKKVKELMVDLE